jgi:HTH-type transcriptional regulator, competence development regulator
MDAVEFGKYIKELRNRQAITLDKLGELAGLSKSYLSHIENGKRGIPSPDVLYKLKDPLGVDHVHLMLKAGHIQGEESDILETDFEAQIRDKEYQNLLAEIKKKASESNDLFNLIENPKITYKNHRVNEHDRRLITIYLDTLFENR